MSHDRAQPGAAPSRPLQVDIGEMRDRQRRSARQHAHQQRAGQVPTTAEARVPRIWRDSRPRLPTTSLIGRLDPERRLHGRHPLSGGAEVGGYCSFLIASGSLLPLTRMSTVLICEAGMLVAADSPVASSPAGFHEPTTFCWPSCVVTTMS